MIEKINELNELKTDAEKLLFCQKYNKDFIIRLDNDSSSISLNYNGLSNEEIDYLETLINNIDYSAARFTKDFGNRKGVFTLFKMLNISAEYV